MEWLLLYIFVEGHTNADIKKMSVTRHATKEACENAYVIEDTWSGETIFGKTRTGRNNAPYVCYPVAKIEEQ